MERLRDILKIMQGNGEFIGFPEEHYDFDTMYDVDLIYYLNWLDEDTYENFKEEEIK